ncbi:hypothetical protein A2U01_0112884, partial [Trifolium medium]|nr:hypothetical protein [Trifolium medium]
EEDNDEEMQQEVHEDEDMHEVSGGASLKYWGGP